MHLTQFDINTGLRQSQRLLASPERLHAAVLGCFPPGQGSGPDGRTLWRLDRGPEKHRATLLIVSPLVPDLTALNEQAGWATGSPGRTADYDRLLQSLTPGRVWQFRLAANPVRSVPVPGQRGRRVAHVTAAQQKQWLASKAAQIGVSFGTDDGETSFEVTRREVLRFSRGGSTVTLARAQFDGRLRVEDAAMLREALTHGVGPAKGYGCGLLTLAPVRSAG